MEWTTGMITTVAGLSMAALSLAALIALGVSDHKRSPTEKKHTLYSKESSNPLNTCEENTCDTVLLEVQITSANKDFQEIA